MPQVDYVTFLLIIFWFSFVNFFGYLFLNINSILLLLNFQKKLNVFFEIFTIHVFFLKKNMNIYFSLEENTSKKN